VHAGIDGWDEWKGGAQHRSGIRVTGMGMGMGTTDDAYPRTSLLEA